MLHHMTNRASRTTRHGMWAAAAVLAAAVAVAISTVATAAPPAATFHGLVPARIVETRTGPGLATVDGLVQGGGPLAAGATLNVPALGRGGVPETGVGAVALNVTAINPSAASFVTVYPKGASRPNASNLNLAAGRTLPNMVIVPLGADGAFTVYNERGTTNLAVDVLGWFPPMFTFQGLTPARLVDSRTGPGYATVDGFDLGFGQLGQGQQITVPIAGRGGVPSYGVGSAVLNVTAINPSEPSFLTVYPAGATPPNASNLNLDTGRTLPNMVIVPLSPGNSGTGGAITIYNDRGDTHLAVDVLGWIPAGPSFTGLTPARLLETRPNRTTIDGASQGAGPLAGGNTITVPIAGRGGVPASGAGAVALNVTAINPSAASFITVYPAGADRPNASNLNLAAGRTLPNMVIVPLGAAGAITVYSDRGSTNVAVDVLGWFPSTASPPSTTKVSLDAAGPPTNGHSDYPSISADGRYVAFHSEASNLVLDDTNDVADVFVRDRHTGDIQRVSVSSELDQANDESFAPSISADGRYVAFQSSASNLAPGANALGNIYVRDLQLGTTTLVSVPSGPGFAIGPSFAPSISGDGTRVAFHSSAFNLVPGDWGGFTDVFVRDLTTSTTTLISRSSAGVQGDGHSLDAAISADGRFVAFASGAKNLVNGDLNGSFDIFVRDLTANTTERVSVRSTGGELNGDSRYPAVSGDGRYVVFESIADNGFPGDTNLGSDIFVYDRAEGRLSLASVGLGSGLANGPSLNATISADGRYVAFASAASNFGIADTNASLDVYVFDQVDRATVRASVSSAGVQADFNSSNPAISADGRFIAFASSATNLVVPNTNVLLDIYVRDQGTS